MRAFDHTQINLFLILEWIGTWGGLCLGLVFGLKYFGVVGAIAGALLGLCVGAVLGKMPGWLAYRHFFKDIERSSDLKLREMLAQGEWKFWHTIALLQLSARGHDVQSEFPRILSMLESDCVLTRRYGFDALRLVYTQSLQKVPDYDPKESTETCRRKIAILHDQTTQSSEPSSR